MSWTAHVTVATIVENHGRFLCVHEHSKSTGEVVVNQPAGHVEAGETLVQAARRETFEETGCRVAVTGLLGVYTYAPSPQHTYYRFCFIGKLLAHEEAAVLDEGIVKAEWHTLDELRSMDNLRSELVLKCVEDYLSRPPLPLHALHDPNPNPD